MSTLKKLVSWILIMVLTFSMIPFGDFAALAEDIENAVTIQEKTPLRTSGNWTYSIMKYGIASIEGYSGDATSLKIPDEIDGYPVGAIGDNALASQIRLTSVTIPTQVFSIGEGAFYNPAILTVTGYDGSEGLEWAKENGAKVKSLTDMYLNSGIVDLSGVGSAAKKTSESTLEVNSALATVLKKGTTFFFTATDKYGQNYWGGEVTNVVRRENGATLNYKTVEAKVLIDKIIASSDMEEIRVEFVPAPDLMVYVDDNLVEASKVEWEIHVLGDIWGRVSDHRSVNLISDKKPIDVFGAKVKLRSDLNINFSCYYDPNLFSADVATANLDFDITTTVKASEKVNWKKTKNLGNVDIFGVKGFRLTVPIDLVISASGSIDIDIKDVVSVNWNYDSRKNKSVPKPVFTHSTPKSEIVVTGDVKVGLAVGVELELCFKRIVYFGVEGGIHGIAKAIIHSLLVDKMCVDLELRLYVQANISCIFLGSKTFGPLEKTFWHKHLEFESISPFKYNSVSQCTRGTKTIKFALNGGESMSVFNDKKVEWGSTFSIGSPTRKKYNFKGWFTDSAFKNKWVNESRVYNDMTLYAKWERSYEPVSSVSINKSSMTIHSSGSDRTGQLSVTVKPADATNKTIKWSSSNNSVATVNSNGLVTGVAKGQATITGTSADNANKKVTCTVTVKQYVNQIKVSAENTTPLRLGTTQVSAVVLPENANDKSCTWSSSNTNIATVDSNGTVTVKKVGTVVITATAKDGSGVTGSVTINVKPIPVSSVKVNKDTAVVYTSGEGKATQLTASVLPTNADDQGVTWESDKPGIAGVDANGKVTGMSVGTAVITVRSRSNPSIYDQCTVTVKQLITRLTLNENDISLDNGQTAQLDVAVTPDDATDKSVRWVSSNPRIATVSETGLVTATGGGDAVISAVANDGSLVMAQCIVHVSGEESEPVTPDPSVSVQSITLDFGAIRVFTRGASHSIQLHAYVTPENAGNQGIIWNSSDTSIATVDSTGKVTGIKGGTAVITARSAENESIKATCSVTVEQLAESIVLNKTSAAILKGEETVLLTGVVLPETATNRFIKWVSSDTDKAVVDHTGLVYGVGLGEVVITAEALDGSGVTAEFNLTVLPVPVRSVSLNTTSATVYTVGQDHEIQLVAEALPVHAEDRSLNWSSNNTEVATVDENGKVTGIAQGTAVITAQSVSNPEKKATCIVTVKTWVEGIEIHAERKVMEPDEQLQISATVSPEDATDRTVTWSSNNPNVITVNANGVLHAHAIGNAVITVKANDGSEVADTINFTVMENPVYDIQLDETAIEVDTRGNNRAHQMSWHVLPERATNKSVSWFSSNNEVAYVDDIGRVIGVSGGTAVITVQSDSNPEITAQCTVTVKQKVETIFVSTDKVVLINGETVQMRADVGPSDADNPAVIWTSSNNNVATVTQNGEVTAMGAGTAVISVTAQDGSYVSDSIEIIVEKWMKLSGSIPDSSFYLKGKAGIDLGDVMLTRATVERIVKENKTAVWTLTGGGNHSKVSLVQKPVVYEVSGEEAEISYVSLMLDELISNGTDTYILTCTADNYSESIEFSVTCDGNDYAENVSIGFNDIAINTDEVITIPATPYVQGEGTLPDGLILTLTGDVENAQIFDGLNGQNISFSESSVYTITAEYSAGNLIYSVPVTIRVKGADGLVKLPVKDVVMSAGNVSMVLDETLKLEAAGFYGSEQLDCAFEWSSSDETVATVSSDGELTACGIGTAVIYAYAANSNVYDWCTVRVGNVLDFVQDRVEATVYIGGEDNVELENVQITSASVSRLETMGLNLDWKIEKVNGNSAELAVQELDFSTERDAAPAGAVLSLVRIYDEGDTSFQLICSADIYQAVLPILIHVVRPEKPLPDSIQLYEADYTAEIYKPLRINTNLIVTPTDAVLPEDAEMHLNQAGAFGRAVNSSSFGEDYLELVFGKSGTYTGELEIRGTNYTYTAPFTVAVADENGLVARMPEEVRVSPEYQFLMVGETVQMSAEVLPEDTDNKSVIWSSYDETVATVSEDGLVTAVSTGSAVIHAASADADVYGDSMVYVEDGLSMAKAFDNINVYLDGLTRTVLDTYYLSYASSARFAGKTPAWTLNRVSGSNLTLKAMPTEELATDGIVRIGAVVSLHSVTRPGTTVYDLTCTIDGESTTMRLTVKALERGNSLPDSLSLDQTDYYATVGELIVFEPEISSIPSDKPVPADLRVSFELDDNAKAVVNENDYFVSRARSTFSFKRAGTYYANAVYSCGNVNYTIPVTFHIADQDGNVPVFVNKLTADPKELFLEKGDTARIQAVISPLNATDQDVTYISVNPDIATVSLDGTVTAVTEGYTQILITPSDDHVNATVCNVTVEKGFNVISAATSAILYLQGAQSQNLSSFMLTEGTMQRLAARGLTPEWTVTRKSGNAATYGVLISEDNRQLTLVTEALRQGGTDVYSITCTAGTNTWKEDFTLQVTDLADTLPESVAVQDSAVTMEVGEMRTIRFAPEYAPANATLPDALRTSYIYSGLGNFYDAVNYDVYKENGDEVEVAFTKPGTYLLSRTWYHLNLQYSALCIITVTGDEQTADRPLMKLSDTEYTVYAGGKSAVTVTADIYDAFAYEAFADRISWSLERISGDSVTASLVNNGRHVGVYVANVKKEGNDVWRLTCRIGDYSESADITIHAIIPRTSLPDSISLPMDTFTAMAGEYIYLSFDVTAQPAGTRLPDTGKDFWRLEMRDTEDQDLIETVLSDTGIKVRFREVGSYSGTLIYESGNAKYEVPVYFYITDEAGEVTDDNLKLAGSYLVDKVWMDGLMGVGIGRITLVDGDNGVASGAGAALVKKAGAEWSITVTSGGSCGRLAIAETDPGQAQVMLVSASIAGTVEYRVTCTVAGKTYTYDDAIEVVSASTPKPALNMTHTTYTLAVGETVVIDRRILFADTGAKFASASAENWNNAGAIAAMGYGFEANGDTWVTTFYEEGTFRTTVDIMVGNLAYSLPINFKVLSPGETVKQTVLRMPSMLLEIEDEAMLGVKANVIDMRSSNITTIGRKAFGGNSNLETAYLPASIRSIADDAFDGSNYVIIVCPKGSYADTWATKHGIAVEYEQNN